MGYLFNGGGFKTGGRAYGEEEKVNDCGTGIPVHEVEALARFLLPEIQAFFESEEGQREFAGWKARQEANTTEQV